MLPSFNQVYSTMRGKIMTVDPKFYFEVYENNQRILEIIQSQIFTPQNVGHPLYQSAFTEMMIRLNDLLQKCKNVQTPVIFTEDVPLISGIANITDLVN